MSTQTVTTFNQYAVEDKYNGYLKLVKMEDVIKSDPNASIVTESRQAHGFKRIVYTTSGTHDIQRFRNIFHAGDIDIRDLTQTELDTALQSGVDKSGTYGFVGTFDPNEGEDVLINIHGQHIVRSNPDAYQIEMYDTDFASLVSVVSVDKTTGNLTLSGVATSLITLQIGASTQVIIQDGIITLAGATVNLNLTDLYVSGTLTVEGATTLNSTAEVNGATTINSTLSTTGNSSLHGGRVDTGA